MTEYRLLISNPPQSLQSHHPRISLSLSHTCMHKEHTQWYRERSSQRQYMDPKNTSTKNSHWLNDHILLPHTLTQGQTKQNTMHFCSFSLFFFFFLPLLLSSHAKLRNSNDNDNNMMLPQSEAETLFTVMETMLAVWSIITQAGKINPQLPGAINWFSDTNKYNFSSVSLCIMKEKKGKTSPCKITWAEPYIEENMDTYGTILTKFTLWNHSYERPQNVNKRIGDLKKKKKWRNNT